MDWTKLPQGVLGKVLQELQPCERFSTCALVCRAWAEGALEATSSIRTKVASPASRVQGVLQWLQVQGNHLTQLQLENGHGLRLGVLPCPQLRTLLLRGFKLQLAPLTSRPIGPSPDDPGLLHVATELTQLVLEHVTVLRGSRQLTALSALSHLHHLVASELQEPAATYAALPGCLLSQLLQLTHLQLACGLSDEALIHLSCLTRLRHLQLERLGAGTSPAALSALQALQKLTCLWLEGAHFSISHDTTPSIGTLTGLQVLQLHACDELEPGLLCKVTLLERLQLHLTPFRGGDAGLTSLLALLPKLKHLSTLELTEGLTHQAPTAAAYSAISVHSGLQALQLSRAAVPAAAWHHIFPQDSTGLLQLTSLSLSCCTEQLNSNGLQQLVQSCPHLHSLTLNQAVQLGVLYTPLLQLPALTHLTLSDVDDAMSLTPLAQLTGLVKLRVLQPSSVSDVGVLHLTALMRLTSLLVSSDQLSRALRVEPHRGVLVVTQSPTSEQADVWARLSAWCSRSQVCQQHMQQALPEQVAALVL